MADPEITANIGSLDPLPDGEFEATDLFEVERPRADPDPNDNYRATFAELTAAVAASLPPSDAAQTGDVLITARDPGAGWLELGRIYSQSSYPDLFDVVGLISDGPAGASWSSWAPGTLPNTPLTDACWLTDRIAVACGTDVIWRTTDGGASWSSISVTGNLLAIARVSADVAVACGGSGVILRSTDAGATWSAVTSGTTSNLRSITVFSESRIFFHSDTNGHNRLSTDGGATVAAGANTASGMSRASIRFTPSIAVCFSDSGTTAYRTTDGGASWSPVTIPSNSYIRGAQSLNDRVGIAAYFDGAAIKTSDAGATWASITTGAGSGVRAVEKVDDQTMVIVSDTGSSAVTFDGTASWQTAAAATGCAAAFVIPGESIVAVGNGAQMRSLPEYGYDSATQFKTPIVAGIGTGLKGYIKA